MDLDTKLGASALVIALVLAAGCGGQETTPETVYLDVFNAYPGTSSMSMYGPSGAVATSLGFGQLSPGTPTPVNRNLGTEFELLLNGAPSTFEVDLPLYNLYPEETATVFFKRRSGAENVDTPIIFRHLRTGYKPKDRKCRLVFDNALSVDNDHIGQFNYLPVFKIRPSCTGYNLEIGSSFDDSKPLNVSTQAGTIEAGRPDLYQRIKNFPWFIPTEANSGEIVRAYNQGKPACGAYGNSGEQVSNPAGQNTIKWVWAGGAEIDYESGSFRAPPPSQQYMNCIGWDPDRPKSRQSIKSQQVKKCEQDQNTASPIKLNEEVVTLDFTTGIGLNKKDNPVPNQKCGAAVRVSTDFFNVFESSNKGNKNKAARVEKMITYKPSQYYYWVLYGRPVAPRIQEWGVYRKRNPEGKTRGGRFIDPDPYFRAEGSTSQ